MFNNSMRRLLLPAACFALAAPAFAQEKDNLTTQYGDIQIKKGRRIQVKGDLSGVRITGPETLIAVPYPRSHSVLVLHADDIVTKSEGADQFAHATLTGNVRYTMTQNVSNGVSRIVTGTAERAVFNHKSQRVEMDGSVHISLIDPERLALPGTIRAGHAVVEMDKSPYLYTLSGPVAKNDIEFTPKEDAPQADARPKAGGIGAIRVSGYDTGAFQVGQKAHFEGGGTVITLNGKDGLSSAEIRALRIDAEFMENRAALKTAKASGGAEYTIARPDSNVRMSEKAPARQEALFDAVTGRSDSLEYQAGNLNAAAENEKDARFTLAGHVNANITAPGSLQAPAKIKVDRLIARIAKSYSYEMKSAARDGLIRLAPLPPKPKTAKTGVEPPKPGFALGVITVSRFDYGQYAPGASLRLTTAQGKLLLESSDADTQTETRFLARDVTADIAPDNRVTSAKAAGDVEFRVRQTSARTPDPKAKEPKPVEITQVLEGTAPELNFAVNGDTRSLTMPGPFRASVVDPAHLVQPGTLTGEAGDKLIATLTGDTPDYAIESPNDTAELQFTPLPPVKKADAKPAPGKKPVPDAKAKPAKKTIVGVASKTGP